VQNNVISSLVKATMNRAFLDRKEAESRQAEAPWGTLRWLASGDLGNSDALTIGYAMIKKGMSNPRHRHKNSEEILHLLRGRLKHTFGDESVTMEPGDTITIEAGIFHNALSIGDCDAEMIVAYPTPNRTFEQEK